MSELETSRSKGPARGYSWEPFKPGNTVALRSGMHSPRMVEPIAQEFVDRLMAGADVDHLQSPSFQPAVWAWARAEARVQLAEAWLAQQDDDTPPERLEAVHRRLQWAEGAASRERSRLGLDPLSRAKLGKDVAQGQQADVARLMAELALRDQQTRQDGEQA